MTSPPLTTRCVFPRVGLMQSVVDNERCFGQRRYSLQVQALFVAGHADAAGVVAVYVSLHWFLPGVGAFMYPMGCPTPATCRCSCVQRCVICEAVSMQEWQRQTAWKTKLSQRYNGVG
jgi:hypothetical protein